MQGSGVKLLPDDLGFNSQNLHGSSQLFVHQSQVTWCPPPAGFTNYNNVQIMQRMSSSFNDMKLEISIRHNVGNSQTWKLCSTLLNHKLKEISQRRLENKTNTKEGLQRQLRQSTCFSSRGPRFSVLATTWQLTTIIPFPRNPIPSGLWGHCMYTVSRHMCKQNTPTYKMHTWKN